MTVIDNRDTMLGESILNKLAPELRDGGFDSYEPPPRFFTEVSEVEVNRMAGRCSIYLVDDLGRKFVIYFEPMI